MNIKTVAQAYRTGQAEGAADADEHAPYRPQTEWIDNLELRGAYADGYSAGFEEESDKHRTVWTAEGPACAWCD